MVFAVWAAREPTPAGLAELEEALVDSVRPARAEPERSRHESSDRYGYPAGFLARYFEKLRYSFGPRERAGLLTFLELARDVGELERVPELRFVAASQPLVGLSSIPAPPSTRARVPLGRDVAVKPGVRLLPLLVLAP